MTTTEAAKFLRVTRCRVLQLIYCGRLAARREIREVGKRREYRAVWVLDVRSVERYGVERRRHGRKAPVPIH